MRGFAFFLVACAAPRPTPLEVPAVDPAPPGARAAVRDAAVADARGPKNLDAACDRMGECDRAPIDGCCVECHKSPPKGVVRLQDMFFSITSTCAERILDATTCEDVRRELDDPSCESP